MVAKRDRKSAHERSKKALKFGRENLEIDPRASWATLAKTNGLQARFRSSPGAFLNVLGAPRNAFQALLAAPEHPKTALGAARAHFWRP